MYSGRIKWLAFKVIVLSFQPGPWLCIVLKIPDPSGKTRTQIFNNTAHSILTVQHMCKLFLGLGPVCQYGLSFCNFRMLKHIEQALLFISVCSKQWDCATRLALCFSEWDFKMHKRNMGLHDPLDTLVCMCESSHRTVSKTLRIWAFLYNSKLVHRLC